MPSKNKNKIFTASLILGIICLLFLAMQVKADSSKNLLGWIWGGSDDGAGVNSGVGWISMNNATGGGVVAYGVNVPVTDGELAGSAYSENMGFIAFDDINGLLTGCPSGTCKAYRVGNDIKGWARFSDIAQSGTNAGGNLGWISLSGNAQNGDAYGLKIGSDNKLSGYAWSDEFGYISFSGTNYGTLVPNNCAANTCVGLTCDNGLNPLTPGTKPLIISGYNCAETDAAINAFCADTKNCGLKITTTVADFACIALNSCTGSESLPMTDCTTNSISCPSNPKTIQCPGCQMKVNKFIEIAPSS